MIFTDSEMFSERIRQNTTSEHSGIKLQLSNVESEVLTAVVMKSPIF
jgi:hypothetical protein